MTGAADPSAISKVILDAGASPELIASIASRSDMAPSVGSTTSRHVVTTTLGASEAAAGKSAASSSRRSSVSTRNFRGAAERGREPFFLLKPKLKSFIDLTDL